MQFRISVDCSIKISLSSLLWRPTQLYLKGRGRRVNKKWGTVIPVYSWHTLLKRAQNTQKTAKASTLCVYSSQTYSMLDPGSNCINLWLYNCGCWCCRRLRCYRCCCIRVNWASLNLKPKIASAIIIGKRRRIWGTILVETNHYSSSSRRDSLLDRAPSRAAPARTVRCAPSNKSDSQHAPRRIHIGSSRG